MMTAATTAHEVYRNGDYTVREAGAKGYIVCHEGNVYATRVASIGHGPAPRLGIVRAIAEADKRAAVRD